MRASGGRGGRCRGKPESDHVRARHSDGIADRGVDARGGRRVVGRSRSLAGAVDRSVEVALAADGAAETTAVGQVVRHVDGLVVRQPDRAVTIGVDDRHSVSIERSEEAVGASTDAAADHGSEGVRATEIARRGSRRGRGRRGDSLGVRR